MKTENMGQVQKRISLDFDGVFNRYTGWDSYYPTPPPKKGIKEFLQQLNKDHELIICTARDVTDVNRWLEKYSLSQYITLTSNKKYPAKVYIDDRAIQFNGDYKQVLNDINKFKPYWEVKI